MSDLSRTEAKPTGIRLDVPPDREGELQLSLPARAENVAVVRQALTGLAEAIGLGGGLLADLKTAVSEACNNVVVHAYGGEPGPLQVSIASDGDEVTISVLDEGCGLEAEDPGDPEVGDGVGLSLINALAERVELDCRPGEGTRVKMIFPMTRVGDEGPIPPPPVGEARQLDEGLAARNPQAPLIAAVLGRMIAILAARANFSLDRLSDAQLVSDAISAHAPAHGRDGVIRIDVDDGEGAIELVVGPLVEEGAERLVRDSEVPGLGLLLEQLVDEVDVRPVPGAPGELLLLRLREPA